MRIPAKPLVALSVAMIAFSLAGCTTASIDGPKSSGAASSPAVDQTAVNDMQVNEQIRALLPDDVRKAGVLKIATDPTYPPFEQYEGKEKIVGWDIDMGTAVSQVLGLEAKHVAATFDTILPGLKSHKYDLGMSAFSMTPERQETMDMVQYLSSGTGLAVMAGNPKGLSTDAATLCGMPIGAQKGTSQALEILPELSKKCTDAGKPAIDMKQFPAQSDANLALLSGRVDGLLAGAPSLAYQGKLAGKKFVLAEGEALRLRPIGVALPKDSPLTDAVDAAIKEVLASDTYAQLNDKWDIPASSALEIPATAAKK